MGHHRLAQTSERQTPIPAPPLALFRGALRVGIDFGGRSGELLGDGAAAADEDESNHAGNQGPRPD